MTPRLPGSAPALFSVQARRAVVSGGSRGIGFMIARGLLEAGAEVLISSRNVDACQRAVEALSGLGRIDALPADLSNEQGVLELAAAVRDRWDRVDVLVNNAGASWGAPLDEFPDHAWTRVLDTNVRGVFELTVALIPELRAAAANDGPARVINIGSVDGIRVPSVENYSYSASKAAAHMVTRHLAKRLAGDSITVNAIAPGPFETKMTAFALDDPVRREAIEAQVPLGRIGGATDVVGTTIFLASPAASYITGAIVPLDGGITGCG